VLAIGPGRADHLEVAHRRRLRHTLDQLMLPTFVVAAAAVTIWVSG
jgi:hypothetical protein